MPIRPCPVCGASTPRVIDAIPSNLVWYYRCPACGHVWSIKKEDPDGPTRSVTPPPKG